MAEEEWPGQQCALTAWPQEAVCGLARSHLLGASGGAKVKKHAFGTREVTVTGKAVGTGNCLLHWPAVTQAYESVERRSRALVPARPPCLSLGGTLGWFHCSLWAASNGNWGARNFDWLHFPFSFQIIMKKIK